MDVSEEERLNIFDIDSDTFGFLEYAVDIFKHLREVEVKSITFQIIMKLALFQFKKNYYVFVIMSIIVVVMEEFLKLESTKFI